MGTPRFPPEFKEEAVHQITERYYPIADVSEKLGVSAHSLYKWLRSVKPDDKGYQAQDLMNARTEILKLKVRLKRTEEERDILKKAVCYFAREPDLKYRFINDHRDVWSITVMCRVLKVAHAGFYVWFHCPVFVGSTDNQRLLKLFRNYYALSGSVYCDLHDCDTYILGHHFFPHVCGTSETRTSTPSLAFQ